MSGSWLQEGALVEEEDVDGFWMEGAL